MTNLVEVISVLIYLIYLSNVYTSQISGYVSILGDPQLRFEPNGPRVMLEAWNFCNRAGPQFSGDPTLPSPRYADCVGNRFDDYNNCTFGPYGDNCISTEINNSTNTNTSNAQQSDQFTIDKEAKLATLCKVDNSSTYFWSAMLKNGNYITSSNLCQCPYPPKPNEVSSISSISSLSANNLPMNQPFVIHKYTDMSTWNGYFEGTWDLNASKNLINIDSNISYFKLEWMIDNVNGDPIFRNTIKTSEYYPWLMLYTGVDIGYGEKGGTQYLGRGMMKIAPSTDMDFIVQYNLKINTAINASTHSSFYFLNMGSCWKHNNNNLKDVECDGNTTTDVTRYVLMETNPDYHVSCSITNPMHCPRYHTFVNGTIVDRNDTNSYPYDAYKEWCAPWNCDDLLPGEPVCDKISNPMSQSIMKLAPHKEWGYHGFPSYPGDGYTPSMTSKSFWTLHVGKLLSRLYFSCTDRNLTTNWTTFNIGPEAGIGSWNGYSVVYEWDIQEFDVLIPSKGSK